MGLASDRVWGITQDETGRYWFATSQGVTRYTPPEPAPPPVFIDAVVADRRYEGVGQVDVASDVDLITFEFRGISFRTRPEALLYRYRLQGWLEG